MFLSSFFGGPPGGANRGCRVGARAHCQEGAEEDLKFNSAIVTRGIGHSLASSHDQMPTPCKARGLE